MDLSLIHILGRSKALVCREGLLDIASYLEIDARVLAVAPDNLSSLLEGMDAVIDCLDSIPRKKMLENAARAAGLPFLHGSVLRDEGSVSYTHLAVYKRQYGIPAPCFLRAQSA